jgi:hypothetical protein
MPTASSVRKATLADVPRLALALASAFQDDPVIAWVFPDEKRRRRVLPAFMEFRLRRLAFPHDQVWMSGDRAAAAVWIPPPGTGQEPHWQRLRLLPPLVRFLGLRTVSVLGGSTAWRSGIRMIRRTGICSSWVPSGRRDEGWARPCWRTCSPRVDAEGMPAYLESSNERNLALYGRHGFKVTAEVVIPGGPRIWPMSREARR